MAIRYKVVKVMKDGKHVSAMARGKFRTEYKKGEIVHCYPKSMGIMCFKRKYYTKSMIYLNREDGPHKVIRVNGIGIGKCPKNFSGKFRELDIEFSIREFIRYGWKFLKQGRETHPGTICYQSVKVID